MVGVCSLETTSCTLEDAGKYTCSASNALGKADTSCRVIVHGEFIRIVLDRTTVLYCIVGLFPKLPCMPDLQYSFAFISSLGNLFTFQFLLRLFLTLQKLL